MERLSISLDAELAAAFDELIKQKGYENRSEAVRDLIRNELGKNNLAAGTGTQCVGVLSYVFDHHVRQLSARLTDLQHDHHNLAVATMHAHISHEDCLETVILRGSTEKVSAFAQSVIAETGVRHGQLQLIPVEPQKPVFKLR